ncbi:DUF2059 domain-containing protein [Alisedimentitalea sp. MJ-SS2]|uniref:DUF2059 domain-containing protein n=1 Tax=Aliisedimentitalea sp. MJ-SS2 TaxID=3049795 RepID=UPI0029089FDC|nr:DUF2059 domain-containing protein [Alisedimentitalea sp. MJ-SS2]MDU8926995.1 DUF2059 domain-containing protein [Alisedimentitalea sp. MJ-SS2]
MIQRTRRAVLVGLALSCLAFVSLVPARAMAAEADYEALNRALGIPELLVIMHDEGLSYGADLGVEFLPDGGGASWAAVVARIYDVPKMQVSVLTGLKTELPPEHLPAILEFFRSERGKRIVAREILARRAFLDGATEEAAREAFRRAEANAAAGEGDDQSVRLALLRSYIEANALVDFNVAGGLTASLRFYRGLVDGGASEMSEEEMLAEVWSQEAEIRSDTGEWLMAYLMMAYDELSDEDIEAYVSLSKTEAGKALNRALFAGFDAMYADLSYALGLAVAMQMKGEDL